MRRHIFNGIMAALVGALTVVVIALDREAALAGLRERKQALAEMAMVHAETAIDAGDQFVQEMLPDLARWDRQDVATAAELHARAAAKVVAIEQVASFWYTDAHGNSLLNSWSYPARIVPPASGRPYWLAHRRGDPNPVVAGDDRPGSVSGRQRFTISYSTRDASQALTGVAVAGVWVDYFLKLYSPVKTTAGSEFGIFAADTPALVREPRTVFTEDRVRMLIESVSTRHRGNTVIQVDGTTWAVGWKQSERYPKIFAVAAAHARDVLHDWATRAFLLGCILVATLVVLGYLRLQQSKLDAAEEHAGRMKREADQQHQMNREVHHRVKNSLQIVSSLLRIQERTADAPHLAPAFYELGTRIRAIASVHELLQHDGGTDSLDFSDLLHRLCALLEEGTDHRIQCSGAPLAIDPARAANLAILANELITNAIKHAHGAVAVTLTVSDVVTLSVRDDGPGLPPDFTFEGRSSFGLKLVASLVQQLGGTVATASSDRGAEISVRFPRQALTAAH